MTVPRKSGPRGFTLVELLVSIAIIGVLIGLMFPAVQAARESSRRMACSNNLRNQILALHNFHAAQNSFPAGRTKTDKLEFSWCLDLLPYLEQTPLYNGFDRKTAWNDSAENVRISSTPLAVFRCPSSILEFPGDTDYGGVMGSSLTSTRLQGAFANGTLVEVTSPEAKGIRVAEIIDGTSQTICIAESSDRFDASGRWISGFNCFSHDNGTISVGLGEIGSMHSSGAFAAFADGSTRYLSSGLAPYVLGALCTRNLGEIIEGTQF